MTITTGQCDFVFQVRYITHTSINIHSWQMQKNTHDERTHPLYSPTLHLWSGAGRKVKCVLCSINIYYLCFPLYPHNDECCCARHISNDRWSNIKIISFCASSIYKYEPSSSSTSTSSYIEQYNDPQNVHFSIERTHNIIFSSLRASWRCSIRIKSATRLTEV